MSNSIWKKPEETPKDFCDVVLANFRTGSCCVFLSPFHNVSFDYDKWCYLDALIAQANKAERAIWWLKEIVKNHRYTPITTAEMALKELDDEQ